jgi:hypothetical protein
LGAALVCLLVPAGIAPAAPAALGASHRLEASQQTVPHPGPTPLAAATLEQCDTAAEKSERSVTFVGEMTALPDTARMAIRIELEERLPEEALFHAVRAPALGVWRESDTGVKAFKYLNKVANLSAPAVYRAAVDFRWLNAKRRQIKRLERHTTACEQPALAPKPTYSGLRDFRTGTAFGSSSAELESRPFGS